MILVDSDILIHALRGAVPAQQWIRSAREQGDLIISVIAVTEIAGGMRSGERRETWSLLSAFDTQPVSDDIAIRAGEHMRTYRRSHSSIGIADYIVAATAELRDASLATLNVKHYPMFRGLRPPFSLS